jgi:hypothetical protein
VTREGSRELMQDGRWKRSHPGMGCVVEIKYEKQAFERRFYYIYKVTGNSRPSVSDFSTSSLLQIVVGFYSNSFFEA